MPNFEVWPTAVADRRLRDLRGQTWKNAKDAMDRLERRGCEAADYHLEGDEVERLCVVDLGRDWRMIVAFPERDEVAVILVGRHIEKRPQVDVYRRLYESIGIEVPTMTQRKGHPPWARCSLAHDGWQVIRIAVREGGALKVTDPNLPNFSGQDGVLRKSPWEPQGSARARLGGARIELGSHPIADELRALGLPKRA